MSDPFGIIGLIGVAAQIIEIGVQFGLGWKDAPADIRGFNTELQALKTALSELNTNIILNQDFRDAFTGKSSAILSQLEPGQHTDTSRMLSACRTALETLLVDLKKRAQGHRIGWERLKAAFMAAKTRDAVGDLSRRCQMLNNLMAMDTLALGTRIHKEVIEGRQEQRELHHSQTQLSLAIRGGMEHLNDQQAENERKSILEWLTPVNYGLQQSDFINRREPGTGEWLLQSEEYQSWLVGSQKTLFCPGIPGAGKTILTSIVIDDLSRRFHANPDVGIAYIYCNYRRQEEETATQLLANLLKQLSNARSSLPDTVISLYDQHKKQGTRPTYEDIMSTLLSVITLYSNVCIIVDALDECTMSGNGRARLLTEIAKYQASQKVNFFTTTRTVPEIKLEMEEKFKGIICLEIYATKRDVQRYLEGHTSQLPRCATRDPKLREEIKTVISDSVNGMFLLTQLFLDSLKAKKSPKAVRTALVSLPTGSDAYDKAYTDAMERICRQPPEEEELAKQVLMWIICAKRPLMIRELEHAIATEPGGRQFDEQNLCPVDDMISVCAGLVTTDKESGVVRLVHYTTQQYFQRTQSEWFPQAETFITTTCMAYLSFDNCFQSQSGSRERRNDYPLYPYAARYWGIHARGALHFHDDSLDFLKCKKKANASVRYLDSDLLAIHPSDYPSFSNNESMKKKIRGMTHCWRMTGLQLVAYFGIPKLFCHLIGIIDVDERDDHGNALLRYAIERRNLCFVQELLDNYANPNLSSDGKFYSISSGVAIQDGYEECVRLILRSTRVIVKLNEPLRLAASTGQAAIVQLLLDSDRTDGDVEEGMSFQTPLSISAANGDLGIVKLMIANRSVHVDAKDGFGRTPLSYATESRQQQVVQFLLDNGANVNSRCKDGHTTLSYAAQNGSQVLIGNGADVSSRCKDGRTPLSYATRIGSQEVAQLLIGNSADVSSRCKDGRTPLSYAARRGSQEVAQLLIGNGADVNSRCKDGRTPLSYAAQSGSQEIVQLLVGNGADINSRCKDGWTPLLRAAQSWKQEVVRLLLDNGAEIISRCGSGRQTGIDAVEEEHALASEHLLRDAPLVDWHLDADLLLLYAAGTGNMFLARAALQEGVNINFMDGNGRTAFSYAVKNGHEIMLQLLLENGANILMRDTHGPRALSFALYESEPSNPCIQIILEHGLNINSSDKECNGLLFLTSCRCEMQEIFQEYLSRGNVDFNVKDLKGMTAFGWAVNNGNEKMVQLLLDSKEINLNQRDKAGKTELCHAYGRQKPHRKICHLLRQHGATI